MNYTFLYRDAVNFRTTFNHDSDLRLEIGQQITLEQLGVKPVDFYGVVTGNSFDDEFDHNFLEVLKINSVSVIEIIYN